MLTKNRIHSDKIYLVQAGLILSLIIFITFLKCIYDGQKSKEIFLNERKESIYQKVESAFELFKHLELRLYNNKNDEKALLSILKSNHNGKVFGKTFNVPLDITFKNIEENYVLSPYGKGEIRQDNSPELKKNMVFVKTSKNHLWFSSEKKNFITTIKFRKEEIGLFENEHLYNIQEISDLVDDLSIKLNKFTVIKIQKKIYNYNVVDFNRNIIYFGFKTYKNIFQVYIEEYLFFLLICCFLCFLWIRICQNNYKKLYFKVEHTYKSTLENQNEEIHNLTKQVDEKNRKINNNELINCSLKKSIAYDAELKNSFFLFQGKMLSRVSKKHEIIVNDLFAHIPSDPSLESTYELALNVETDFLNLDLIYDEAQNDESIPLLRTTNKIIEAFNIKAIENEVGVRVTSDDNCYISVNKFIFEVVLYNIFRNIFDRLPKNGRLSVDLSNKDNKDFQIIIQDDGYAISSTDVQQISSFSRNIFKLNPNQLKDLLNKIGASIEELNEDSPRVNRTILSFKIQKSKYGKSDVTDDNILHFKR